MKYYIVLVSLVLTFAMYWPLWSRIFRRRTTGDHSKWTWGGIMVLQVLGLWMAWLDGAQALYTYYYPAQMLVVGFTNGLVWWFYD